MTTRRREGAQQSRRRASAAIPRSAQAAQAVEEAAATRDSIAAIGLLGADELPVAPDCAEWRTRPITINDVLYDVIRRPRLFRYAALRHAQDPTYEDLGELRDVGYPEDIEVQDRIYESKLWCFEFDVDVQGVQKTLRAKVSWPERARTFGEICQPSADFPGGIKSFLGFDIFPVVVRVDEADPRRCELTLGVGGWTVHEIRYVVWSDNPFGMLEEDRPAATVASNASSPVGVARPRRRNTTHNTTTRRQLFDAWLRFKIDGGTRYRAFLDEEADRCSRLGVRSLPELKKALDSERKALAARRRR